MTVLRAVLSWLLAQLVAESSRCQTDAAQSLESQSLLFGGR